MRAAARPGQPVPGRQQWRPVVAGRGEQAVATTTRRREGGREGSGGADGAHGEKKAQNRTELYIPDLLNNENGGDGNQKP
jgi:hypothetical protein